jgi:hypothetical protein
VPDAPPDPAERASSPARRWLKRGLVVLGLALIVWMISRFPLSAIADACASLGFWVFVTPVICMGWFAASTTALYYLLERAVPWRALFWNRLIGEGYNAIIPAAGIGGEPFKLKQLSSYVDTHRALVALINDRLIENAIALAFSAVCVGVGALTLVVPPTLHTTMLTYAAGATGAAALIVVLTFTDLTSRIGGRVARWLGSEALGHTRLAKPILARAFLWTAVARLLSLVEIGLLFALLGLDFTVGEVAFTGGALAAAGFVGGVIPQGLGVAEAASVGIFELLHFPGPAGVAFALARRGRTLVVSVTGVLLHLAFARKVAAPVAVVETDGSQAA